VWYFFGRPTVKIYVTGFGFNKERAAVKTRPRKGKTLDFNSALPSCLTGKLALVWPGIGALREYKSTFLA